MPKGFCTTLQKYTFAGGYNFNTDIMAIQDMFKKI